MDLTYFECDDKRFLAKYWHFFCHNRGILIATIGAPPPPKDCGGGSICEHNRVRIRYKDCEGGSICKDNRVRHQCKECGGGGICEHNMRRSQCKDCGEG